MSYHWRIKFECILTAGPRCAWYVPDPSRAETGRCIDNVYDRCINPAAQYEAACHKVDILKKEADIEKERRTTANVKACKP